MRRFMLWRKRQDPVPMPQDLQLVSLAADPAQTERQYQLENTRTLAYHLWAGLGRQASEMLASVVDNSTYSLESRFHAAHKLASWLEFQNRDEEALAYLQATQHLAPQLWKKSDRYIKEALLHFKRGDILNAESILKPHANPSKSRLSSDTCLLYSNGLTNSTERMAAINQVLQHYELLPLQLRDKANQLTLDNIQGGRMLHATSHKQAADVGMVSCILPVYNSASTLETALRSLLEQTYKNIELIIVDDCSTDETCEIAEEVASKNAQVRLVRQAENAGAYVARNRGLQEARGRFVTTHDADDWSHPQKIEHQLMWLLQNPKAYGVCTNWVRCTSDLIFTSNWRLSDRLIHWSHSSFLFHSRLINELGGWDPVRFGADSEMIQRCRYVHGESAVKVIYPQIPYAFARDEASSLTRSKRTHVKTIYYGVRQNYHQINRLMRYERQRGGDPKRLIPQQLASKEILECKLDYLFCVNCTSCLDLSQVVLQLIALEDTVSAVGIIHTPSVTDQVHEFHGRYLELVDKYRCIPIDSSCSVELPNASRLVDPLCRLSRLDEQPLIKYANATGES